MHLNDELRPDRTRTKPSTVYRNVEILYHPDSREWSFLHPEGGGRVFLRAQGSARMAIDRILGRGAAERQTPLSCAPWRSSRRSVGPSAAAETANGADASLAHTLDGTAAGSVLARLPATGRAAQVQLIVREMYRWKGALPANFGLVPNKAAVESMGKATYPELAIVDVLRGAGWDARWRMNFGGSGWWTAIGAAETLPLWIDEQVGRITNRAAEMAAQRAIPYRRGGIWDVVAWQGDAIMFVELKGGEPLNTNQLMWLEAALQLGIPQSSFAIVGYRAR